jgi:hypothetical protein
MMIRTMGNKQFLVTLYIVVVMICNMYTNIVPVVILAILLPVGNVSYLCIAISWGCHHICHYCTFLLLFICYSHVT